MTRRTVAGLIVALAMGAVFGAHRIVDPDPFQRVALGREIIEDPGALARIANLSGNRQEAARLLREAQGLAPDDSVKEQVGRDPQLSPVFAP
jgi:hypothetical protein